MKLQVSERKKGITWLEVIDDVKQDGKKKKAVVGMVCVMDFVKGKFDSETKVNERLNKVADIIEASFNKEAE